MPLTGGTSERQLYDAALEDDLALKVLTYSTIVDPVGITVGEYYGKKGLFVTSFEMHSIFFISLQHDGHTRKMEAVRVSGSSYNIDVDGTFETASYAQPSRLAYDQQCNLLFVACKKSRVIRVLNFRTRSVTTLQADQESVITFASSDQYQSNLPGLDIHSVAGNSLYVTDTTSLYRVVVSGTDPYCDSIATSAALIPYHSLAYYFSVHGYPDNSRITSVLPDQTRQVLFVAISEGKNVILKVPMASIYNNQFSDIVKLVGNEGLSWSGSTTTQFPPVATNGVAWQAEVTLAFPMHLQLNEPGSVLFWTECYPYAGEFLLGSLAVRRMSLSSGERFVLCCCLQSV